jgi:hypothetical protein
MARGRLPTPALQADSLDKNAWLSNSRVVEILVERTGKGSASMITRLVQDGVLVPVFDGRRRVGVSRASLETHLGDRDAGLDEGA